MAQRLKRPLYAAGGGLQLAHNLPAMGASRPLKTAYSAMDGCGAYAYLPGSLARSQAFYENQAGCFNSVPVRAHTGAGQGAGEFFRSHL